MAAVICVKRSSQGTCPVLSCTTPLTRPYALWSERSPEVWTGDFSVFHYMGAGGALTDLRGGELGRPAALVILFYSEVFNSFW